MSTVVVEEIKDLEALTTAHAIEVATREVDHVTLPADPIEELIPPILEPDGPTAGERMVMWLGRVDGRPVGTIHLSIPTVDNLESLSVDVRVHPDARRRGYGRQLLDLALAEVRTLGRRRVWFEIPSPYPYGAAPAESMLRSVGARPVLGQVRRLLDLTKHGTAEPAPPAVGYRVVQWVDIAPEEYVTDLARLVQKMSTDPPMGELDYEPEVWDAARYREREQVAITRNRARFATGVVHEESGVMVGMTDIGVNRDRRDLAYQWDTIVEADHRGHGLGLTMKAWNLLLLSDRVPEVRWVNTWNAESNTHMIAVNETLGFEPVERWAEWQLDF